MHMVHFSERLEFWIRTWFPDEDVKLEIKIKPDITCEGCPGPRNTALIAILLRFSDKHNPFKE